MHPSSLFRTLRHLWLAFLLAALSSAAFAAEKHYRVTTPDGLQLAVQEAGNPDGPAIVFIHGLLGSRLNWQRQVNSPLLQDYRLITYDMRGHGLSDKPADSDAYNDGRRYADDLAAVLAASGAKRPVLVGWSLGGLVISDYLAAHGDAAIGGAVYVNAVIELTQALITPHPEVYAGLASDDLKTHLDALRAFVRLCFHTQPDTASMEVLLTNAAMASWPMTRSIPGMRSAAAEGLPKAQVPLLLLYGARDQLVQVQPSIARAQALNPRAQAKRYAQSGHAPFFEEAERFNEDLAAFMKTASAGR
ncbi:pimeloyl-ACP methyl ester carboxylesterase [Pseudomonas sp. AG1028]|uniref:alpha/beta fold hydrolase n=1 Tax=Pseudomonas sp. AG1028 TaxID=2572911 RepID=UPI0011AD8A0A|nr:alpha/beta hydrolase [Pseudomonas sp. AG1028]TWE05852.1 pimeloyl-ACP methyl ester carboxylesterase [Pseudomonas sp. AG1028]